MNPEQIAEWIGEIGPGRLGLISEDLYGLRVNPGSASIDRLLRAIDAEYIDFNPKDVRFNKLVTKIFGRMPTAEEWQQLLARSNQSPELQHALIQKLGISRQAYQQQVQMQQQAQPGQPSGAGQRDPRLPPSSAYRDKYRIHFKRGTIVTASYVKKVTSPRTGKEFYYIGIYPGKGTTSAGFKRWNKRANPDIYARIGGRKVLRKFRDILTANPENISKIEKIR